MISNQYFQPLIIVLSIQSLKSKEFKIIKQALLTKDMIMKVRLVRIELKVKLAQREVKSTKEAQYRQSRSQHCFLKAKKAWGTQNQA